MKSGFAKLQGTEFYYETEGEGPSLLLVHAGIADSRMWEGQFLPFARHYRVTRYDRRGFGRTPLANGSYSHHEDLYGLLTFLGISKAILLGCSQGAKIVTELTLEHPEMVDALVLVAPALGGFRWDGEQPAQFKEMEEAEAAGDFERVNELELQIWVDGRGRRPAEVNREVRELVREMNRIALAAPYDPAREQSLEPPAIERLHEIRVPTLIITGDLDTPKTLAAARVLAEKIGGAESFTLEGTAHLPNMERPADFNERVLSFLKKL